MATTTWITAGVLSLAPWAAEKPPRGVQTLRPAGAGDWDEFGHALAAVGDHLLVGSPGEAGGAGSAWLYLRDRRGEWRPLAALHAADGREGDHFGFSVALSERFVVVGAPHDDDLGHSSGAVHVFERSPDGWRPAAKLVASDGRALDYFGHAVAISGERLLVGAPRRDVFTGAVYAFERRDGRWVETDRIAGPDGGRHHAFGSSLALCGDRAAVGAPGFEFGGLEQAGAAYLLQCTDDGWEHRARRVATGPARWGAFGCSLALSSERLVVGARGARGVGEAYVLEIAERGAWGAFERLPAGERRPGEGLGASVALGDERVLVGASRSPGDPGPPGAAALFERVEGEWVEVRRVNEDCAGPGPCFGRSVALAGNALLVAASDPSGRPFAGSVSVFGAGRPTALEAVSLAEAGPGTAAGAVVAAGQAGQ